MIYILPTIFFAAGGVVGYLALRHRRIGLFGILALALAGGCVWGLVEARRLTGWDAIARGLVVWLFMGPALLGQIAGGGIGLYRGRKSGQRSGP